MLYLACVCSYRHSLCLYILSMQKKQTRETFKLNTSQKCNGKRRTLQSISNRLFNRKLKIFSISLCERRRDGPLCRYFSCHVHALIFLGWDCLNSQGIRQRSNLELVKVKAMTEKMWDMFGRFPTTLASVLHMFFFLCQRRKALS